MSSESTTLLLVIVIVILVLWMSGRLQKIIGAAFG